MSGSNGNGSGNGSGEGKPSDWGFYDLDTAMSPPVDTASEPGLEPSGKMGKSPNGLDNVGYAWNAPAPLTRASTLPIFPDHLLPAVIGDMVRAVVDYVQVPVGMAATCALGTLAAVYGGYIEIDRDGYGTDDEPVNLFVGCVAQSGDRKSAVLSALTAQVLFTLQKRLTEVTATARADEALTAELAAKELAVLGASLDKNPGDGALYAQVLAAQVALSGMAVTPAPRVVANDMTPEAMVSLMYEQGGPLAAVSAEGNIFNMLAGQYSGQANLVGALSSHNGEPITVDRKTRGSEHIPRPALTIALMVQPGILAEAAAKNGALSESGFLARLTLDVSPSLMGRRNIEDQVPIPPAVRAAYVEHLVKDGLMLRQPAVQRTHERVPLRLTLSGQARAMWKKHIQEMDERGSPHGDLTHLSAWVAKSNGLALRIAGLLHVVEHGLDAAEGEEITAAEMTRALTLVMYYLAHAQAAYDVMSSDGGLVGLAHKVMVDIVKRGLAEVSTSILLGKGAPAWRPSAAELRTVFALLVEYGWLREKESAASSGPRRRGRPRAPVYVVDENAFKEAAGFGGTGVPLAVGTV